MHRLDKELEEAAFRILYRHQYEAVTSLVLERKQGSHSGIRIGDGMRRVLNEVTDAVIETLKSDHTLSKYSENFEVTTRVKGPYSIWRNLLRNRVRSILGVPDAIALRVVLNARKLAK
mmetsp:Transcript_19126/g.28111  ORF Transcript_19126/g.28111 Transcript_19126/m.28111 type:complete len:118 (+) Transcript_19126:274-627(+)